jgi:hypothetical protein
MTSYTALIAFVCSHCMKANVQKKRYEGASPDAVRVLLTGTKIFCNNPDCNEQMYDVDIHQLQIVASSPIEVDFLRARAVFRLRPSVDVPRSESGGFLPARNPSSSASKPCERFLVYYRSGDLALVERPVLP